VTPLLVLALVVAWVAAFASVVLGRNLTRSVFAAGASLAALGLVLVEAGGGYPAWFALAGATLALALVQLFGWMLVDVDRDHLPATDRLTALARGLAFVLLAGGIAVLGLGLAELEVGPLAKDIAPTSLSAEGDFVGKRFFGSLEEGASLVGLLLAATLLASLMLLRGEGRNR